MLTPPKQLSTDGQDDGSVVSIVGGVSAWVSPWNIVNASSPTHNETSMFGEKILLCDCTSTSILVNLPTAVANSAKFNIKKTDSSVNNLTIDGAGSEQIEFALTAVLQMKGECITIISDGSNWIII